MVAGQPVSEGRDRGFTAFVTGDPLIGVLGPIRWRVTDDCVEMEISPAAAACNAGGYLHGGALSAWLDTVMYELARQILGACVTVTMSVQFLDAGSTAPLRATARIARAGRSMTFCVAEITQDCRPIASATGVYKKTGPA